MQQSYLTKHTKRTQHHLPALKPGKQKNSLSQITKLRQPTQQSLMLQIQDIDQSLNNKNFNYRHGNLFSTQISDRLINQLHSCLKKQIMVIQDGFGLWNGDERNGEVEGKRLTNKLETLNQKMAKLSLENVYQYDLKKYMQIMKINKNRWSLFKRVEQEGHFDKPPKESSKITTSKFVESSVNPFKDQRFSNESISINTSLKSSPKNKQQTSQQTTLSPLSKISKIIQSQNESRIKQPKQRNKSKYKRHVLTQISQSANPEEDNPQISKYDIKKMLKKQQNLISIWLPPSTYPQFNGMFTYAISQKNSICRLRKYFFFRRTVNQRFMNSLIEEISSRQNRYIEGVQILTNKHDYTKIYQPIGWKMRAVEGMDKIRIRYAREHQ